MWCACIISIRQVLCQFACVQMHDYKLLITLAISVMSPFFLSCTFTLSLSASSSSIPILFENYATCAHTALAHTRTHTKYAY